MPTTHVKDARDKLSRRNDKRKSDPYLTSGTIKSRLNGGGGRVNDGIFLNFLKRLTVNH